jgi:hypothetical protein
LPSPSAANSAMTCPRRADRLRHMLCSPESGDCRAPSNVSQLTPRTDCSWLPLDCHRGQSLSRRANRTRPGAAHCGTSRLPTIVGHNHPLGRWFQPQHASTCWGWLIPRGNSGPGPDMGSSASHPCPLFSAVAGRNKHHLGTGQLRMALLRYHTPWPGWLAPRSQPLLQPNKILGSESNGRVGSQQQNVVDTAGVNAPANRGLARGGRK